MPEEIYKRDYIWMSQPGDSPERVAVADIPLRQVEGFQQCEPPTGQED